MLSACVLPVRIAFQLSIGSIFLAMTVFGLDVSSLMLLLMFIRLYVIYPDFSFLRSHLVRVYIAFGVFGALTYFWAQEQDVVLSSLKVVARITWSIAVSMKVIRSPRDLRLLILPCVFGLTFIVFFVAGLRYGYFGDQRLLDENFEVTGRVDLRVSNFDVNPNTFAIWVVACLLVILHFTLSSKKAGRYTKVALSIVSLVAAAYALILLGSRLSLLLLPVIVSIHFLKLRLSHYAFLVFLSLFGFWVTGEVLGNLLPDSKDPLIVRFREVGDGTAYRYNIYHVGIVMIEDNIVGGVGLGNSKFRYYEYSLKVFREPEKGARRTLHNTFLTMSAELGVVGLVLSVVMVFSVLNSYRLVDPAFQSYSLCIVVGALGVGMTHAIHFSTFFLILLSTMEQALRKSKAIN